MSGTRFARTGRVRFLIFFAIIILMILCVAMFQSTQTQLDETRELRIRCEHQQEGLNGQLQSIVEQKYSMEKDLEHERKDHMQAKSKLEQQLKDLEDLYAKSKLQWRVQTEKQEQQYKLLQNKYDGLDKNFATISKQQMENVNGLEKKLQSLRSELQKEKSLQGNEVTVWKEKYNTILKEKERLEGLKNTEESQKRILKMENLIDDYRSHCDYKPKEEQQQINSPIQAPQTTNQNSPQREDHVRGIDKPQNNKDQQIAQKPIKKLSEEQQETQLKQQPNENEDDGMQFKNNEEEKAALVPPLSSPNKASSTTTSKAPMKAMEANANLKQAANATSSGDKLPGVSSASLIVVSSSSSALPPLALPPNNLKKLPENVAPIPDNFDELLKKELKDAADADGNNLADINAAIEDTQKMENDENKNNRYSNIVKDMELKDKLSKDSLAAAAAANGDSGAHEIKDQDDHLMNEKDFNLPEAGGGNDDANFFDAENKDKGKHAVDDNNDDDDDPVEAVGNGNNEDIAVKNHNQLLDADNLKNEIAGDQGKDFQEGLHLDEGIEEEEEDDDYSNPGARPQGAQPFRI